MTTEMTFDDFTVFDHINFALKYGGHDIDYISLHNGSREMEYYWVHGQGENALSLAHPDTRRLYHAYHANPDNFTISFGNYSPDRREHLRRVDAVYLRLSPLENPHLTGTESLDRLHQAVEWVRQGRTNEALIRASREGANYLKTHTAWMTHTFAAALSHANRSDNIRWSLISQNMEHDVARHFDKADVARFMSAYDALDSGFDGANPGDAFHYPERLTRTDLGLGEEDRLPVRIYYPKKPTTPTSNPRISREDLDVARSFVLTGVLPVFNDDMLGPLPSPPAEEEGETSTE